ncbi:hypothetical protein AVEN_238810-1 [Araneus ventricosus]|uniref:Uncharacterized protein n=1 Tax=Araneus ventricosus TaxID=182803 RepID=A0A4Y2HLD4_ARAVE|nr:hypothetical protein AVEN_238810-1 [Araneus ventricosus]
MLITLERKGGSLWKRCRILSADYLRYNWVPRIHHSVDNVFHHIAKIMEHKATVDICTCCPLLVLSC